MTRTGPRRGPPRTVAVALGSGGARGYAHIGALQVLEEEGLEVVSVSGSSMGAVIGAVFAAGGLGSFTEWVTGLSPAGVVRMLDPAFAAPGAIRADRIIGTVRRMLAGARIEDLPIPFTAVATDLQRRRSVWFRHGPADVAVRASIALPGFITPVTVNGRLLADGGLLDPVPIAAALSARADVTIAISLIGERAGATQPPIEAADDGRSPAAPGHGRVRRRGGQLVAADLLQEVPHHGRAGAPSEGGPEPEGDASVPGALPSSLTAQQVVMLSLDAMQYQILEHRLGSYPPDVLVSVPKDACHTLDFHRAGDMIDLGRRMMKEALAVHDRPGGPEQP